MSREVVPSAARTTSGNSGRINIEAGVKETLSLWVDITVVSGTGPQLDLSLEWTMDGTNFVADEVAAQTFTQKTATGRHIKRFTALAKQYRIVWTIAGTTPSFTFSIREEVFRY